jgi:hypothetical protein
MGPLVFNLRAERQSIVRNGVIIEEPHVLVQYLANSIISLIDIYTRTIFHGQVQRMAGNRWPKQVLEWMLPGKEQMEK